ncbi:MAG: amino acid ABC transporter permease [Bifidobacterium aquikefiri]|uniref:ABC transporter permease n=1 Tax=Bifidobacterium aquikefiri TaxID=1653207 RepID=A0A261GAL7_9BIFI|nr:amino acid ABC transporter permease [Bifidobacterium aquikefiri]OZG68459.1 ABC transporter permease [Bifidobacterium aquikefiri]
MPTHVLQSVLPGLLQQVPTTLLYWFVPSAIALLLGTLLCIVRVGQHRVLYWACTVFISFFRGTPGIVQIYIIFFGLPKLFWAVHVDIDGWPAGAYFIIATSLNLSCFVCEVLKGGYLGVDHGQIEAGKSIGFGRFQNFFRVIAPQTLQISILNLKNLEIDVLKDTSVAYTIGAMEILGYANRVISNQFGVGQLWILGVAAIIYFILCALLELGFTAASHHMERHGRRS